MRLLREGMRSTFQFEKIDMLNHGRMVDAEYSKLLAEIERDVESAAKKLGLSVEQTERLARNQIGGATGKAYRIYHDCGKHLSLVISEDGRRSYPNHAKVSAEEFAKAFDDDEARWLIENDMAFHTMKGDELENWLSSNSSNKRRIATLLLTAWAEIRANAEMFGGVDSDSFKMKKKRLRRAGRAAMRKLEDGNGND